jgi:hypothetical protein
MSSLGQWEEGAGNATAIQDFVMILHMWGQDGDIDMGLGSIPVGAL